MKDVSIFIDIHDSNVTINGDNSEGTTCDGVEWAEIDLGDVLGMTRRVVGSCTCDECMHEGDDEEVEEELLFEQLAEQLKEIKQRSEEHVVTSEFDIKLDETERKLELKLEAELSEESTSELKKVLVYLRKLGMLEDQQEK